MKAFIFVTIISISRILSLKSNRAVARFLGRISWQLSKKNKHVTLTNIQKCFPHLSADKQLQLAKNSTNATIMNMMELGQIWKEGHDIKRFIGKTSGVDQFSAALKQGKGLLLAVPHMGNWEVLNLFLSQFDKFAFLYKPPSDKKIEQHIIKYRSQSKALQIEATVKGVRKIMLHLKDKGFIGILPDQRPKKGQGHFAPFYNIPTYTMSLFSKLAIKTKVPVFFAYALRTEEGFDVFFEQSSDDIYTDIETSVAYMNKKIQDIVDKAPEQYQWTYKRFSIQPEGQPRFY